MPGPPVDIAKWKGLFEWSMRYQDGTKPTDVDVTEASPEKLKWLEEALEHYMQDFTKRMKDITAQLGAGSGGSSDGAAETAVSLPEQEALLDELMEIVEQIDFARDLGKIGGLRTLLDLLQCEQPTVRYRAAEVAGTCMQNNPPVQATFLEGGVLPPLLRMLHDDVATCRAKALFAISCLVRNCPPALAMMLSINGLPLLLECTGASDPRQQRKALRLLEYVAREVPATRLPLLQSEGVLDRLPGLLQTPDNEVLAGCLGLMQQLLDDGACLQLCSESVAVVDALRAALQRLQQLTGEDRDAVREQLHMAQALCRHLEES